MELAEEAAALLTCTGTPSPAQCSAACERWRGSTHRALRPAGTFPPQGWLSRTPSSHVLLLEPEIFRDGRVCLAPSGLPFQIQNES